MLTKEQQRVFDWLNEDLDMPICADAYKGALSLLNEESPGYITFVSHTGRDLINILTKEIAGKLRRSHVEYATHVGELEKEWEDKWGTANIAKPSEDKEFIGGREEERSIPYRVLQKIQKLIDEHRDHRDSREKDHASLFFTTFLSYSDKDRVLDNFLSEWKEAKDWFIAHTHLRGKSKNFSNDTPSKLKKHFETLDKLMYIAASSEFERAKEINEILEETNQ